ncbi:ABC transporter ATP-binding protein [Penaeicola halotolerans]|uniref:ABC transporter ATP-binding protein n=1 Tax=Penaeicola halotolerans TaxID=2793196 RepID=UPI001CF897F3|nr:ABC transporter ATP-binding protein [Penaeicola halotolerans]
MSFLKLTQIEKHYDSNFVLGPIDLVLDKGKVLAILGESGSGKSTLLKIIAGLLPADRGNAFLDGDVLQDPREKLIAGYEEVKLIHQDLKLHINNTVRENIKRELLAYDADYAAERIALLLELFKLEHLADQKPTQLSGGQRQKAAIAKALAIEPQLVLLDEPFSQLDTIQKRLLLVALRDAFKAMESTVIMVTHDYEDALQLADEIVVIKEGKIMQRASSQEIYHKPNSQYVASLFGETYLFPLNLFAVFGLEEMYDSNKVYYRPSALYISSSGVAAQIKSVQFLGLYSRVTLDIQGSSLTAYLTDSNALQAGEQVNIQLHTDQLIEI